MRFGLFGGPARRGAAGSDRESYADYIASVVEAERLGFYGVYLVEHHFTGHGQVSASLPASSVSARVALTSPAAMRSAACRPAAGARTRP